MVESDHNTPAGQYNVFPVIDNEEWDEMFTVEVTDSGIYLDHNMVEGCLYLSHEDFEDLNEFRQEFCEEITR